MFAQSNNTFYNNKHKTHLHKINNQITTSTNPNRQDTQNQITLTQQPQAQTQREKFF